VPQPVACRRVVWSLAGGTSSPTLSEMNVEATLNIAVIAWGSLLWNTGTLDIRTPWHGDGPALPLEFARISRGGRLTLVLFPNAENRPTFWAVSNFENLDDSKANLADREGSSVDAIHVCVRGADQEEPNFEDPAGKAEITKWLLGRDGLDGAIWTGLASNWASKRGKEFSVDDAVRYLSTLQGSALEAARDYITRAPPQIDTPVRRAMRARGWQDAALPAGLLAENQGNKRVDGS